MTERSDSSPSGSSLLPCPFCGADMSVPLSYCLAQTTDGGWAAVCNKCEASGPVDDEQKAYLRWNTRAGTP